MSPGSNFSSDGCPEVFEVNAPVFPAGVGLVVAFRGTASYEDVLVDVNIAPTVLKTSHNMRGALHDSCCSCVAGGARRAVTLAGANVCKGHQ